MISSSSYIIYSSLVIVRSTENIGDIRSELPKTCPSFRFQIYSSITGLFVVFKRYLIALRIFKITWISSSWHPGHSFRLEWSLSKERSLQDFSLYSAVNVSLLLLFASKRFTLAECDVCFHKASYHLLTDFVLKPLAQLNYVDMIILRALKLLASINHVIIIADALLFTVRWTRKLTIDVIK